MFLRKNKTTVFLSPYVHYINNLNAENKTDITSVYNRLSGHILRAEIKQGNSLKRTVRNHSLLEGLWLFQSLYPKAPNYPSSANLQSCSCYGWIPNNRIHSL